MRLSDDDSNRSRLTLRVSRPRLPLIAILHPACLLCVVCLAPVPAQAGLHGELTLASDYVLRGVSQSDRQPVVQSDLRIDAADGVYAGVFASPVAYAAPQRERGLEADVYLGYAASPSPDLAWEFGARRYHYAGLPAGLHDDFSELHAGLSYRALALAASYSPRYYDDAHPSLYLQLDYLLDLGAGTGLALHLGQRRATGSSDAAGERYSDWEIRLQQQWQAWALRLAWAGSPSSRACPEASNACGGALRMELRWRY